MSVREIKALHQAFAKAAVRHGLEAVAGVFARDTIILPPDAVIVHCDVGTLSAQATVILGS